MTWIDRVIEAISPAWAWRRRQFRQALAELREEEAPARCVDADRGWVSIEDTANPLHPSNLGRVQEDRSARLRKWLA